MFNYGRYVRGLCDYRFSAWYVCFALLTAIFLYSSPSYASTTQSVSGYCGNTPDVDLPTCMNAVQSTRCNGASASIVDTWFNPTYGTTEHYIGCANSGAGWYARWRPYKEECPDGYDEITGGCNQPEPEPILCSDPQVQKDIQQAQYACQLSQPSDMFFQNEFQWSCTENPAPQYPNVSTSCNLIPKDCIQGLTCEEPSDTPHCNPANEECSLPPPTPDLNPDDPNTPNPNPSFCELHPQLCESPTPPESTPEPNPSPGSSPSPDNPDMSVGENANNKELAESNQHLENINHNIKELDKRVIDQLQRANELAQHQLGELKEIRKKPTGGNGAGTTQAVNEGNQKLDDIACLLDDNCESEGKEKPTANVDCDRSIFECKGDVIQCALLKVQYENTCTIDELNELEAAFAPIVNVDNEGMLVQADVVDFGKLNTTYLDNGVSFGVSATCPASETFSLQGETIEISFAPACRYAELVRPLVIFSAWLTGLLLIGRSQGMI